MTQTLARDKFDSFTALAREKREGEHYSISTRPVGATGVAIVAPHGGKIEPGTAEMARAMAGEDHGLYIFDGLEYPNSFYQLHVTSCAFDEPRCLDLIARSETTITVHGCKGGEPVVYLGGRDTALRDSIAAAFNSRGVRAVTEGHRFDGLSPDNICNRNRKGAGVQLEFSRGLRDDPHLRGLCVEALRVCLERGPGHVC